MLQKVLNKENILIIKKWNITKLANAAYLESHSVSSFMTYDFHGSTFLQFGVYLLDFITFTVRSIILGYGQYKLH